MGTMEAGIKWDIGIGTDLYAGVYMDYGLNDMVREKSKNRFVEYNYENPAEPQINGLLTSLHSHSGNSRAFVEKVTPLAIGIKLKLAFSAGCGDLLAERRRYRDMQTSKYRENDVYDYPLPAEPATQVTGTNDVTDKAESDTASLFHPEVIVTDTAVTIDETGEQAALSERKSNSGLPPVISIDRYKPGQIAMTPEQKSVPDEYAVLLLENPQAHIEITGHTCDLGKDGLNLRIGQKRADLVGDYLVGKGIAPSRISTFSRGETEPLFPNTGEENRRKNRRLEIKIRE
jgi:outer membrane protein OmpA-like peptidoglycan-associated protein